MTTSRPARTSTDEDAVAPPDDTSASSRPGMRPRQSARPEGSEVGPVGLPDDGVPPHDKSR